MSYQTELPKKSKLDIAGILVYVLIVSVFLFVWILTGVMETPISEEAAKLAEQKAIIYSLTESGSAVLEGIDESYQGNAIEIPSSIDDAWVYRIESGFLDGSDVRHVLMDELPNSVADDAFSGVEGLIIYTDNSRIIMESWAQGIEVRPEAEYENVPKVVEKNVDRKANLMRLWGNAWFVIGVAAALLAGLWLLGKLRVSWGFADPYRIDAPLRRKMGFFKKLYVIGTTLAAVIGFLLVFGESFDYYADYSQMMSKVNGYVKTYGIPAVAVMLALVLIRDFFRKDLLWLLPRLVMRVSFTALMIGVGTGVGALMAALGNHLLLARGVIIMISIAIPTMAMASVIAPLMVLTGIDKIGGESRTIGPEKEEEPESSSRSYEITRVRAPDGSLITVRNYSHGSYVGNDQIVGEDSRSFTGLSGTVYTKK